MKLHLSLLAAASLAAAAPAAAQVQPVSFESFDYPTPALLAFQSGGSGWASDWTVGGNMNEIVVFDTSVPPAFPLADNIGNYAGQAQEFVNAQRFPSPQGHNDIHDGVGFGRDGATIWISFNTWTYQAFGTHFGALSLISDSGPADVEELLIGTPWMTGAWGIDDEGPNGNGPVTIAGTMDTTPARLVVRIDHMAGDERVRMWVNPTVPHPTSGAQLDEMVHDFRWSKIELESGGSGSHSFWDAIAIEKGQPSGSLGVNYCGPANANSTGAGGMMSAVGSTSIQVNNLTLRTSSLPNNAFGFFLTSRAQGFAANPGGSSGNLCLGNPIGRYVGPGQIKNTGSTGGFDLLINLNSMPQPTGAVPIVMGETWNFQAWFRDAIAGQATSNFTDGLSITF